MTGEKSDYVEAVGLFHAPDDLEKAISTLTSSGWNHADLSLLAQHNAILPEHVGAETRRLADDDDVERQPPVSDSDVRQGRTLVAGMTGVAAAFLASGATIMTGGGTLAAILGAAAAGGGAGALAEILGNRVGSHREEFLREQIDRGGILLWVKTETPEDERKAQDILVRCGATDIHSHVSPADAAPDGAEARPKRSSG